MYDSLEERRSRQPRFNLYLSIWRSCGWRGDRIPDARDFIRPGFDEASYDVLH